MVVDLLLEPIFWTIVGGITAVIALFFTIRGGKTNTRMADAAERELEIKEEELAAQFAAERASSPNPIYCNKNLRLERKVQGREEDLRRLRDDLTGQGNVALTNAASAIAIKGTGGLGKTTLARHYADRYQEDYTGIVWIAAETPPEIEASLAEIGAILKIPSDNQPPTAYAKATLNAIRTSGKPWLLIYDNAPTPDVIQPYQITGDSIHTIVTSRWSDWPGLTVKDVTTLPFAKETDPAPILLMQEAERSQDAPGARNLAEALGGLPLALVAAGGFLKLNPQITFADYARDLSHAIAEAPTGDYPDAVIGAVQTLLQRRHRRRPHPA